MFSPLVLVQMLTDTTIIMSAVKPTDTMRNLNQPGKRIKTLKTFVTVQTPVVKI